MVRKFWLRRSFMFLLAGSFLLISVFPALAQDAAASASTEPGPDSKLPPDTVLMGLNVDQVSLLVTARNKKGDYISHLGASDFVVLEDGVERPIRLFKEDTVPVNVVFMIDASYSVEDVLPNIAQAAINYASHLRPGDRFSALTFAHKPIKLLDWTTDVTAFQNLLKNVKTFGKTALYDSMEYAIENMFNNTEGKKGLVILSDGVDNSSKKTLSRVMRMAADREITVYPIINAFPQSGRYRDMAKYEREKLSHVSKHFLAYIDAQNEFINLVGRNGGRILFSNGYNDLKNIYTALVEEMKNQYALSYQPHLVPADGKEFREITIKLRNKPGDVSVRLGYFQEQETQ
jgi:VWFA-related protein